MFKSWKSRAAVFAVAATMAVPVLGMASPASAASGGNRAAAHACQQGGWQNAQTGSGASLGFTNQGQCVSYAAKGGQLFVPRTNMTISCAPNGDTLFRITADGFHPNINGTEEINAQVDASTVFISITGPFDSHGSFGPVTLTALVHTGVANVAVSVTDTAGLHASTSLAGVDLANCAS